MSKLNIKQLGSPTLGSRSNSGASIVFDGSKPKWSASHTGGLLLPAGSSAQRPDSGSVDNGHVRYNSELAKFEGYEAGAWTKLMTGEKNFLALEDTPSTFSGEANKFLKVNGASNALVFKTLQVSDLTDGPGAMTAGDAGKYVKVNAQGNGLSYFNAPLSNVIAYNFRVNFSGTIPDSANPFSEVPSGWSITITGSDDLIITHSLGRFPIGGQYFGNFPSGTAYRTRAIGNGSSWLEFDSTNLNTCTLMNCTTTNSGAMSGSHTYVSLWFTV